MCYIDRTWRPEEARGEARPTRDECRVVRVRCSDVASASRPDAGQIVIDDTDLTRLPTTEWRHRTSAVFQDHATFEFLAREPSEFRTSAKSTMTKPCWPR